MPRVTVTTKYSVNARKKANVRETYIFFPCHTPKPRFDVVEASSCKSKSSRNLPTSPAFGFEGLFSLA